MISEFFDLNPLPAYGSPLNAQGRNVDESGENDFRTIAPADIPLPVPENRRTILGESSHTILLLLGSIDRLGVRPVHWTGQSAGHRILPLLPSREVVPHGTSKPHLPVHPGRRQRAPLFSDLPGLRVLAHQDGTRTLSRREPRHRVGQIPVRAGFHDHRPVPVALSLGGFPEYQGRRQDAHVAGSVGIHPDLYPCVHGQGARRHHPSTASDGAWNCSSNGSSNICVSLIAE